MSLMYFAEQNCELVIWETGLGGRLDATNIVTPLASVITNIQYDHQAWLGETLASIAGEKAGIIKANAPVITGATMPEALEVIRHKALEQKAPLTIVSPGATQKPPLESLKLPLLGEHQRFNAAVALATAEVLQAKLPVSEANIRAGLSSLDWSGRFQLVVNSLGQRVLLDGAHNIAGAETLAAALNQYFSAADITLVLGILRDKDWAAMCEILAPLAARIRLVPIQSERTAEPHGLAEVCQRANPQAKVSEHPSLTEALKASAREPFLVIAGSLYLVGEAMELMRISSAPANLERGLNEWQAAEPGRVR
jgi:dihydrofolate synthase/folylpolyglutamate synthase